ncbi:MAG: hypothetical protein II396_05685 [Methanobrevibacter sp.]|nr:hypothetical protein [Methanobrevibacter sp.]
MTYMNDTANIKQFRLIKFINENCDDDHLMAKISIVLRRDKIEAPYYMDSKIRLSSCIDKPENGVIHAMNILNHNRMYNLCEDQFNEIKSLIEDTFDDESEAVKVFKEEKKLKIVLMSKNNDETRKIFDNYHDLFDRIDCLID